jgi:hypothetical protein
MTVSRDGSRCKNGRTSVCKHVIVLPVDNLSNAAAEALGHREFVLTRLFESA